MQPPVDNVPSLVGRVATRSGLMMMPSQGGRKMKLADRIQTLRKQKGYSQEELADKLGVSRQAISKWESEQTVPEMDKIILMSDLFDVTTDYLLKGIEPVTETSEKKRGIGNALSIFAPYMAWIGYISTCALWYEFQNAFAIMNGFIWIIGSLAVIYIAKANGLVDNKKLARYWMISIIPIALFFWSLCYNLIFVRLLAPYPVVVTNIVPIVAFALIVIITIVAVEVAMSKKFK